MRIAADLLVFVHHTAIHLPTRSAIAGATPLPFVMMLARAGCVKPPCIIGLGPS